MTICHMLRHFMPCMNVYNTFTNFTIIHTLSYHLSYRVRVQPSRKEIEETEPNVFKAVISIASTTIGLDQSSYHSTS